MYKATDWLSLINKVHLKDALHNYHYPWLSPKLLIVGPTSTECWNTCWSSSSFPAGHFLSSLWVTLSECARFVSHLSWQQGAGCLKKLLQTRMCREHLRDMTSERVTELICPNDQHWYLVSCLKTSLIWFHSSSYKLSWIIKSYSFSIFTYVCKDG